MPSITAELLRVGGGCPRAVAAKWAQPLQEACQRYEITTAPRLAAFLAQIGHESDSLQRVVENLNYSADGLQRVWPRHFDAETAARYARQPERIANKVYGGRMGNGPESSGDGWRYRGRGPIQVTGRTNYEAMTALIKSRLPSAPDFVIDPDLMAEPQWGAEAAAAYWFDRKLNALADAGDFDRITRRINGGLHGAEDRRTRYARTRKALAE